MMCLFILFCISFVFGYHSGLYCSFLERRCIYQLDNSPESTTVTAFEAYHKIIKNRPPLGRAPLATLNDGCEMPRLGLGTWLGLDKRGPDEAQCAVEAAIDVGYRLIDTASIYNTEKEVGLAINNKINEGTVKRRDIFITTKLWNNAHSRDSVVPALRASLSNLNLDYVDLYLIHFPFALYTNFSIQDIDYLETWQGMIEAKKLGFTKSIGVSNFNTTQLQRLIDYTGVTPAVLQVNLNLQQTSVLEFCKTNDITVMGYTPFGSLFYERASPQAPPPRVDDEQLVKIAKKYNKTVPQVVLRYLFELGVTPIPKSVHKERIEQNIDIFDFELTQEEKNLLKSYDVNYRFRDYLLWKNAPNFPF